MIFVKPDLKYKTQFLDMMEEWRAEGGEIIPMSIRDADSSNLEKFIETCRNYEKGILENPDFVPATTYWVYEEETDRIIGAVQIRHQLSDALLLIGGHIGDGVRPSERRKGYATRMIAMALLECKRMGIHRVLMTCQKGNEGSARSIINNGGVLENEIFIDGVIEQRYWIDN